MLGKDINIKQKNDIVYLYNLKTGRIIFLNKEIYGYLEEYYNSEKTIHEYLDQFSLEDRHYMVDLINACDLLDIKEPKGISVHLVITNKCNLKCKHCSTMSDCDGTDIDFEKIDILIENISILNVETITISGGEPIINVYFADIIEKIKNKMPKVPLVLSTNATLINETNIDFILDNFYQIDISIDGYDNDSCEKIRGKGVFNKVVTSIKDIKSRGYTNIVVSSVFKKNSDKEKEKFLNLCDELGVYAKIRFFMPIGRGKTNHTDFIGDEDVLPISIPDLYRNGGNRNEISVMNCRAGEEKLYVDFDGYLYPCEALKQSEYRGPNISERIYGKDELLTKIEHLVKKKNKLCKFEKSRCSNCDLNIFCWCCPAVYDNAVSNGKIDKWCSLMKRSLNNIIWGE